MRETQLPSGLAQVQQFHNPADLGSRTVVTDRKALAAAVGVIADALTQDVAPAGTVLAAQVQVGAQGRRAIFVASGNFSQDLRELAARFNVATSAVTVMPATTLLQEAFGPQGLAVLVEI